MEAELDNGRKGGLVKAVIGKYGERVHEKKPQTDFSEKSPFKARESHIASKNIAQIKEEKSEAEFVKSESELELLKATKMVRDLALQIEESNSKTRQLQKQHKARTCQVQKAEDAAYTEMITDLESVKQELSKLKLSIAHASEEKSQAEKKAKASSSSIQSYFHSVEMLRNEVEKVNEEQVLIELARIEAAKELADIEAQRKEAAGKFSSSMDEASKKMNALVEEINRAKELEANLTVANSDIEMLQNELNLIKELEKIAETSGNESGELQAVREELEAAKQELDSARRRRLELMSSMDGVRTERDRLLKQTAQTKKSEKKMEKAIEIIHSKLLRANRKLEESCAFEQQAKLMYSSMSLTLDQQKTAAESAKKERNLITEEIAAIKTHVQEIEPLIDSAEERFNSIMLELEDIKSSEAKALEKLKTLTENARKARASVSKHASKITISNFEYEYLTGSAIGAREIADKKVEAAQAWIEALKASERETLLKIEEANKEIEELKNKDRETHQPEKNFQSEKATPTKTITDDENATPPRRPRHRRYSSPACIHTTRSGSISLKKRRKVMLNFAKCFASEQIDNESNMHQTPRE